MPGSNTNEPLFRVLITEWLEYCFEHVNSCIQPLSQRNDQVNLAGPWCRKLLPKVKISEESPRERFRFRNKQSEHSNGPIKSAQRWFFPEPFTSSASYSSMIRIQHSSFHNTFKGLLSTSKPKIELICLLYYSIIKPLKPLKENVRSCLLTNR